MKKAKRFISILLAVLLLASALAVPASAKGFPDVSRSYTYLDAVNYVSDNRIIVGEDDGKFYPNNAVTRCQVIAILWRLEGRPSASSYNKFTDVSPDDYFAPAVTWGVNNRIVAGKSDTTFAPYESVSRQDAITFFYRYATRLLNHNPYGIVGSISDCSDQSQVSSYATAAMRWGVGSKLIIPSQDNSGKHLFPLRAMTRGEFANAVTSYGSNVKRIVDGKDNFSFSNADFSNYSDPVYMNSAHKAKLLAAAQKDMSSETYHNFEFGLGYGIYEQNGLCYGMVATEILDKLGKIDFNERYGASSDMYSVFCYPESDVESVLTYYYLSQRFIGVGSAQGITASMNACMNSTGPVLLSYGFPGKAGRHAILVNNCRKNGSTYEMEVYDPDNPGMTKATLTSGGVLKYTGYSAGNATVTNVNAMTDFSVFDKIDIDGYQNSASTLRSASLETGELDTVSSQESSLIDDNSSTCIALEITLNGPFRLENAEGEVLDYDGTELIGTMDHWDTLFTVGDPAHLLLSVPVTEILTFTPQRDCTTIIVSGNGQLSYLNGTGVASVVVKNGHVSLEGDSMDFSLIHRTYDSSSPDSVLPDVRLNAHAEGTATMIASATNYTIEGISGEYTLQTMYSKDEVLTREKGFAEAEETIAQPLLES